MPASTRTRRPDEHDHRPGAPRASSRSTTSTRRTAASRCSAAIDLTIAPGEVVAILGPSGSGKSTLLRTINHLESVDRGSVTVDGQLIGYEQRGDKLYELREKEILKRRTQIGIVFQNFNLFPHLTALENVIEAPIDLGPAQQGRRARAGAGAARARGPGRQGRPLPAPAVGRPAAARRDRPRARAEPEGAAVRRADVARSTPSSSARCST